MNLIYLGLFNDTDKERVMENFTPFPPSLVNKGNLSYDFIKESFDNFVPLSSIDDICSVKGLHKMRESFYDFDFMIGQAYDTLEWLLSSTFTHIEEVIDPFHVFEIWQVILPEEKYVIFKLTYENHKLVHDCEPEKVFHGINLQCVHSILKNGLRIYSNTKNQTHGSLYGKGIYTSTLFTESYCYCGGLKAPQWEQSGINIKACMFMCDYYHKEYLNNIPLPPSFRIARENEYVIPRYLYVEYV